MRKYLKDGSIMFDKVVLITGGTSGIGKELVLAFANSGYNIAFTYVTNADGARIALNEVEQLGVRALSMCVNVEDEEQVQEMTKTVLDSFGRIDVLINNVGIFDDNLTKNMNLESWKKVVDINLSGVFYCIKSVISIMEQQCFGRIVTIGSVIGEIGAIGAANYSASKAGIAGLTKSVAREVANKGITVNIVSLGYMDGGMGKMIPDPIRKKISSQQIPAGKFGNVAKAAKMIVHLVSDDAEYITGQSIRINGGLYM